MKKLALGVALLASITLLTACGNGSSNSASGNSAKTESTKKKSNIKTIQSKSKTGSVGVMKMTTTKIVQEKVTKSSDDKTNAEYNFDGYKAFPKHYYRTTINYKLTNTGSKKLGLGYSNPAFVDANGQKYTMESNDTYGFNDWSGEDLQSHNSESAKFIMLTKKPIDLKTYTVDTGAQYADGDTKLNDGGVINFN